MLEGQILIDGEWREASGGETIAVLDPSDGASFAEIARGGAADVDAAVAAARAALEALGQNAAPLSAAGSSRGSASGRSSTPTSSRALEARDVGKPLRQARAERSRSRATSSSTPAPPTSCTARPFPTRTATPC